MAPFGKLRKRFCVLISGAPKKGQKSTFKNITNLAQQEVAEDLSKKIAIHVNRQDNRLFKTLQTKETNY